MKEKILAKLKEKFSGLQLEYLGFIANKLAAKITDESKIDETITTFDENVGIKEQADFFQSEGDRRVAKTKKEMDALKAKLAKGNDKDEEEDTNDDGKTDGGLTDKVMKELRQMQKQIADSNAREQRTRVEGLVQAKLKEKSIPATFAKGRITTLSEKEEDIETLVKEIETDYAEVKQGIINTGGKEIGIPFGGQGKPDTINSEIKEWGDSLKKAAPAKTTT